MYLEKPIFVFVCNHPQLFHMPLEIIESYYDKQPYFISRVCS